MIPDFKCVVLTTGVRGIPHVDSLTRSNPELEVEIYSVDESGYAGWYNCDRNIRDWWSKNYRTQKHERYLFLEYDVKVTGDLLYNFPVGAIFDAEVMAYTNSDFPCVAEGVKLRVYDIGACRVNPLAALMLSRNVLDSICRSEMDCVFNDDIYCEVRLPSVIEYHGHNIRVNQTLNPEGNIHHPVK